MRKPALLFAKVFEPSANFIVNIISLKCTQWPYKVVVMVPILEMWKSRLREVPLFAQVYITSCPADSRDQISPRQPATAPVSLALIIETMHGESDLQDKTQVSMQYASLIIFIHGQKNCHISVAWWGPASLTPGSTRFSPGLMLMAFCQKLASGLLHSTLTREGKGCVLVSAVSNMQHPGW